jgi:hypothetical protein
MLSFCLVRSSISRCAVTPAALDLCPGLAHQRLGLRLGLGHDLVGVLLGVPDQLTRVLVGVPAHCPHETPAEVVAKIIYLRTNYHFGHRRPHPHPGRLDSTEGRNGFHKLAKRLGSGIDLISSGRN